MSSSERGDDRAIGQGDGTRRSAHRTDRAPSDASSPAEHPSLDTIFDVLQNSRRRIVLEYLEECDGESTIGELAEHIAGIENDKPPSALGAQERKRVYIGLLQGHLPKMHEAGAIQFDRDRGTVYGGPDVDAFRTYLTRGSRDPVGASWYHGVLAAASLLAVSSIVLRDSGLLAAFGVASLVLVFGYAAIRATDSSRLPDLPSW